MSRLRRGKGEAVADLDSERGLTNATIAKDGHAPLIHDVWVMCWSELGEKRRGEWAQGGRGKVLKVLRTIDAAASAWVVQVCQRA